MSKNVMMAVRVIAFVKRKSISCIIYYKWRSDSFLKYGVKPKSKKVGKKNAWCLILKFGVANRRENQHSKSWRFIWIWTQTYGTDGKYALASNIQCHIIKATNRCLKRYIEELVWKIKCFRLIKKFCKNSISI